MWCQSQALLRGSSRYKINFIDTEMFHIRCMRRACGTVLSCVCPLSIRTPSFRRCLAFRRAPPRQSRTAHGFDRFPSTLFATPWGQSYPSLVRLHFLDSSSDLLAGVCASALSQHMVSLRRSPPCTRLPLDGRGWGRSSAKQGCTLGSPGPLGRCFLALAAASSSAGVSARRRAASLGCSERSAPLQIRARGVARGASRAGASVASSAHLGAGGGGPGRRRGGGSVGGWVGRGGVGWGSGGGGGRPQSNCGWSGVGRGGVRGGGWGGGGGRPQSNSTTELRVSSNSCPTPPRSKEWAHSRSPACFGQGLGTPLGPGPSDSDSTQSSVSDASDPSRFGAASWPTNLLVSSIFGSSRCQPTGSLWSSEPATGGRRPRGPALDSARMGDLMMPGRKRGAQGVATAGRRQRRGGVLRPRQPTRGIACLVG